LLFQLVLSWRANSLLRVDNLELLERAAAQIRAEEARRASAEAQQHMAWDIARRSWRGEFDHIRERVPPPPERADEITPEEWHALQQAIFDQWDNTTWRRRAPSS
jgi:hypothetical protein